MKGYGEYKTVDAQWLGTIPSHWESPQLREVLKERKEKVSDKEFPPLSVCKAGIVPQLSTAAKSNAGDNRKGVRTGDFVINSRSDRRGSSGISKYEGSVSLISHVLCPRRDVAGSFLHYLLRSHHFIEEFYRNGRGIVADLWTTRFDEIKAITLPLPPREEQDQIVRYLDAKTGKINKLIRIKQQQIALLKEKRQAIINQAVTKGLDTSVPMKDSGIAWIGQIPEGWECEKIKQYFVITKEIAGEEGFNVLSVTQRGLKIKDISLNEGQMAKNYSKYQFVHKDDFVMNHMDLLTGYVDCSEYVGVTSPDYRVFRSTEGQFCKQYFLRIFQNCYERKIFYGLGQGAAAQGRWRLPADNFLNFTVPIPPSDEQFSIALYIKEKVEALFNSIDLITKEISILTEYRTRLISDVVTGKVDVRHIPIADADILPEIESDVTLEDELDDSSIMAEEQQ